MTLLTDLAAWFDDVKAEFILNFIDKNRWRMLLTGLGNTLLIALLACLIGIVLGVVVAILRTTWDNAGTGMRKGPARLVFGIFEPAVPDLHHHHPRHAHGHPASDYVSTSSSPHRTMA